MSLTLKPAGPLRTLELGGREYRGRRDRRGRVDERAAHGS